MSDQYEPGKESEIEEGQPTVEEVSPSQYLTKEEAQKYFKNIEDSVIARQVGIYGSGQQKLLEKLEALETNIASLREAGVDVSPAAEMRLRDKAYKEALTSNASKPSQRVEEPVARQEQPQGVDPQLVQRVNSIAANMLQSMGVTFEQNAPELKMIKTNGDYVEYLDSLTQAAIAWKKRNSDKPNPESRIPGIVSGNTATDREAAINQELDKLYRSPQKNMTRINELTKELQSIVRK